MKCGRDVRRTRPGAQRETAALRAGARALRVRDVGPLPFAGVVVDPSVLNPFSPGGLGLTRLDLRRTSVRPPPVVSRLAVDISDPHRLSITYREHIDDAETPLVHAFFADKHPAFWIAALAEQQHLLLTVSDCASLVGSPTAAGVAHAFDGAWAAIIACGADCVSRVSAPLSATCARHAPAT